MTDGLDLIFLGLLIAVLLPVCLTDVREQRIPDIFNVAVAALGLAHAFAQSPTTETVVKTLVHVGIAVLVIGGTTGLMRLVAKNARIGGGDVKFMIAASFWVGLDGVVLVLVLACLAYVAFSLAVAPWRGFDLRKTVPFAPAMAFGMLVVVAAASRHS